MKDVVEKVKSWGMQLELLGPSIPDSQNIASSSGICPNENNGEAQKQGNLYVNRVEKKTVTFMDLMKTLSLLCIQESTLLQFLEYLMTMILMIILMLLRKKR